jgi:DNA-binding LytR/AlgR family response regulator
MKRMKLRVELIDESDQPEIIVRCHARDAKVQLLERAMETLLDADAEMVLTLGDTEYYVPKRDILFFETVDNKVVAHTRDKMYYTTHRLLELETIMPASFVRASKSCIINANKVFSLAHNLTGASLVTFYGCEKVVYTSRAYYKVLKDKIHEIRFSGLYEGDLT